MINYVLFFLSLIPLKRDTGSIIISDYKSAVHYIMTNNLIQKNMYELSSRIDKNSKIIPEISDKLYFSTFMPFCTSSFKNDSCCYFLREIFDKDELLYFSDRNYFFPLNINLTDSLNHHSIANVVVYFSKIYNNTLIATLAIKKGDKANHDLDTQFGIILKIVFIFSKKSNEIDRAFTSLITVN